MPKEFRYPVYDLETSLEAARVVQERGGGSASTQELGSYLNYKSVLNGAYINRLSATRLFGFLEGPAAALTITRRALDILQPEYPHTEARARLDAFMGVPLYRAFLDRYEGLALPSEAG